MQCVICGCTESTPCTLPDGPCAWALAEPPVCSNISCLLQFRNQLLAGAKLTSMEAVPAERNATITVGCQNGAVLLVFRREGAEDLAFEIGAETAAEIAQAMLMATDLLEGVAQFYDEQQPTLFDAGGAALESSMVQP